MLIFGIVLIALGVAVIARTWKTGWDEVIRALVLHPGARWWPGYLKYLGLALTAVGIVVILASMGLV